MFLILLAMLIDNSIARKRFVRVPGLDVEPGRPGMTVRDSGTGLIPNGLLSWLGKTMSK